MTANIDELRRTALGLSCAGQENAAANCYDIAEELERLRAALALFADEANWEIVEESLGTFEEPKTPQYYWDHETITAPWTVAQEALK